MVLHILWNYNAVLGLQPCYDTSAVPAETTEATTPGQREGGWKLVGVWDMGMRRKV